jgi:hypothetical protein
MSSLGCTDGKARKRSATSGSRKGSRHPHNSPCQDEEAPARQAFAERKGNYAHRTRCKDSRFSLVGKLFALAH